MSDYTLHTLLRMSGEDIVELAYDAWLNSDDCAHWDIEDITDRCSEDIKSDLAQDHFRYWFLDEWLHEVPDPEELYADGFTDYEERRLSGLADEFTFAVFDGIAQGADYYNTLMRLPR
jgi:hypothetical protein